MALAPIVVNMSVTEQTNQYDMTVADVVEKPVQAYSGPYTVTPSENTQTLGTDNLRMTDNVTVESIPEQYIVPSGTVSVSQNGIADCTDYASVNVAVLDGLKWSNASGVTF